MKSYKEILNSLSDDETLRQMTQEEIAELRRIFLEAFRDLSDCCERNGLTVMLIGGTALGAVRHKGFIPWDDDLDVAMPRKDFNKLKKIFDKELGDKYTLASPNYKGNALNRFPMMLVNGTRLVEAGKNPDDASSKIKIDIFIIENIPDNPIVQKVKGLWCTAMMFMSSYEDSYEKNDEYLRQYMYKSPEGKKEYDRRYRIGRFFSFRKFQDWMNIVDRSMQYRKETSLMGIPTGRGHYFGEIRPRETFLPVSKGEFEGMTVNLPGNAHDYISNLYGADYMTLPPVEKRERHFIRDISFKEDE